MVAVHVCSDGGCVFADVGCECEMLAVRCVLMLAVRCVLMLTLRVC